MEALQLLKCAIRHDLLFREPAPSSISEVDDDNEEEELGNAGADGESVEVLDIHCPWAGPGQVQPVFTGPWPGP